MAAILTDTSVDLLSSYDQDILKQTKGIPFHIIHNNAMIRRPSTYATDTESSSNKLRN
jgi:hypothetical protein